MTEDTKRRLKWAALIAVGLLSVMAASGSGGAIRHPDKGKPKPSTTTTSTTTSTTTVAPSTTTSTTTIVAPSTTTPAPGPVVKPTADNTGPRVALTPMPVSGCIPAGTYTGVAVTVSGGDTYPCSGPVSFTDCTFTGGLLVYEIPISFDYCDVTGYIGVVTDNLDPALTLLTMRHSYFTGSASNDAMHIGANRWGDQTKYHGTLIEDTVIYSPYVPAAGDHFDLIQFGGGQGFTCNRCVLRLRDQPFDSALTNYVNNGEQDAHVVFADLWIEGGPVGYVLGGAMTITRCVINDTTWVYGVRYPDPTALITLTDCTDQNNNPIQ